MIPDFPRKIFEISEEILILIFGGWGLPVQKPHSVRKAAP